MTRPSTCPTPHLTVWTATFDVARTARKPARAGTRPESAVQVGIQGGYWAVDRTQETLVAAFEVTEEGMAAGDQEKDVQLRLQSGVYQ